jgi:hypothetical protein
MTARVTAVVLLVLSPVSAGPPERISHPKHVSKAINVLWRDPGRVEALDFANGVGGSAKAPLAPFQFVEEDMTGSNPKIKVRDAHGEQWSVKWSDEAKPEVFASRLAWACGYIAQPEYFVPAGRIVGATHLTRARGSVQQDGSFRDARFQLRTKWPKFLKHNNWAWNYNPFVGTKELNGLKVLIMLTSNWDNKDARDIDRDSNLAIFEANKHSQREYLYFVADWGATMGKWGHVSGRNEWDCKGYTEQTPSFVKGVHNGIVDWGYTGQRTDDAVKGIQVSDVAWLMRYLGRITDTQLRAGLRASGATAEETECFTRAVRARITQLRRVVDAGKRPAAQ